MLDKFDIRHAALQAASADAPGKSASTKADIIEAGWRFLQLHPFRALTVGGLMARTSHSRATFYLYFNDLHALMETLLELVKGEIVDGAEPWLSGEGVAIDSLSRGLAALVDVAHTHGFILRAIADAAPRDARLEQVWGAFLAAFDEVVCARIARDQALGVTPPFDPLPVARALNRMDASYLIQAFGGAEKAAKDEVLSAILRVWLSTLYPGSAGERLNRRPRVTPTDHSSPANDDPNPD